MRYLGVLLLALVPVLLHAQITGTVQAYEDEKLAPLPGANVYWEGTETGTVTDKDGHFEIEKVPGSHQLAVSFVGYKSQKKMVISRQGSVNFYLVPTGSELEEVDVLARVDATSVNIKKAELSYNIDDKELRKAACCNLSESFETNASVDVAFADAITGQRQIEMLGQAGKYALIQRENIPFARGINATTGLTYLPGPFVQSIQLTKGLSSVLNGYESITGQINVELHKPETAPALLLNSFANQGGRMELNVVSALDVSDKLSTAFLLHGSRSPVVNDVNRDGFADMPTGSQINLNNRWHWKNPDNGWEGQMGISAIQSDKIGGQVSYAKGDNPADSLWGYESHGRRLEVFGKNGYVFKKKGRSLGLLYSLSYQDHEGIFGQRGHEAEQSALYFNSIYQDIIGTTQHKYRTGISFQGDLFNEVVSDLTNDTSTAYYQSKREEYVPGAYFEYTYEPGLHFTMVAGLRADYNAYFDKIYVTPRLNLRYMPSENTTLRLGGGRGQRTPNVMSENLGILASGRNLNYGQLGDIAPEVAWNVGASINQNFKLGNKKLTLNVDGFYTYFERKLVTDLDFDRLSAYFLLPAGSRSLSVLSQVDYEVINNLEIRLAYKFLHSEDAFTNGLAQSYQIPKHRAFANLAYHTEDQWKFDLTLNWFGPKRLPPSQDTPPAFERPAFSPDFFTLDTQVNKAFENGLELFAGVNNLLDRRQTNPIVNGQNPYSTYFDSNYVWGPIFGRNIYAGLYFALGAKE
ncbi:MAG: TonB-dependent receptor [Owenweeksia sp.]|nr:TonB-dependent receptor [Owenweeksia sp.]